MDKPSQKLVVELMKRGATLLQEPCPKCGGILLRYKGIDFCPVDSNVKSIQELEMKSKPEDDVYSEALELAKEKLRQLNEELKSCNDMESLSKILNNMNALVELTERLKKLRVSEEFVKGP